MKKRWSALNLMFSKFCTTVLAANTGKLKRRMMNPEPGKWQRHVALRPPRKVWSDGCQLKWIDMSTKGINMANAVFTYADTVSYAGQVSQRCIRNLESTIVKNMAGRTFIWFVPKRKVLRSKRNTEKPIEAIMPVAERQPKANCQTNCGPSHFSNGCSRMGRLTIQFFTLIFRMPRSLNESHEIFIFEGTWPSVATSNPALLSVHICL